ncbi:MAG: hypothetical protein KGI28_04295 [Thaumarchaeota archaeon]|nr:hypothetical protein [Nitrososphaerota archaeon]
MIQGSTYLNPNFPSPSQIKADVIKNGYGVYNDVISINFIKESREFWLNYFRTNKPSADVLRGDLVLGQNNLNSFTDSDFWTLYRYFDFLWNTPTHEPTRNACIELNRIRNITLGLTDNYGETYNPQCYGFYNSISYYPPSVGRLQEHEDGYPKDKSTFALLHFMVPLTFKHQDYADGGLTIQDRQTKEIVDVDNIMKPGSVLFFDGALKHGVRKIIPLENKEPIGRLAFFAIPVFFHKNTEMAAKSSANVMASQKSGRLSNILKRL